MSHSSDHEVTTSAPGFLNQVGVTIKSLGEGVSSFLSGTSWSLPGHRSRLCPRATGRADFLCQVHPTTGSEPDGNAPEPTVDVEPLAGRRFHSFVLRGGSTALRKDVDGHERDNAD